jgi:lysozyme family protein
VFPPNFKDSLEFVMRWEGGLVDHPSDPGGITNFGISIRAYPELGVEGIRNMTATKAAELYFKDYWTPCIPEYLPKSASCLIFDAAVNQGSGFARKCLQRACGAKSDGILGPETRRKVLAMSERRLCLEIAVQRAIRYALISTFKTFGKGWMRRLFSCFAVALSNMEK